MQDQDQDSIRPLRKFVTCVWKHRAEPVFSLSKAELRLIASNSVQGWVRRIILRFLRGKRISRIWTIPPPKPVCLPEEEDTSEMPHETCDAAESTEQKSYYQRLSQGRPVNLIKLYEPMPEPSDESSSGGHLMELNRRFHAPASPNGTVAPAAKPEQTSKPTRRKVAKKPANTKKTRSKKKSK